MNPSENRLLPVIAPQASAKGADEGLSKPRGEGRSRAGPVSPPFAAQILGQGTQKRGLKGGQPVLKAAAAAYLGTEYSGDQDRRPPIGLIKRKTI